MREAAREGVGLFAECQPSVRAAVDAYCCARSVAVLPGSPPSHLPTTQSATPTLLPACLAAALQGPGECDAG